MQPPHHLALVFRFLGAETEEANAGGLEGPIMIAKGTRLGRAAARAGDQVPAVRRRNAGPPGARVGVNHRPPGTEPGEIDVLPVRRLKGDGGQGNARQMVTGAVIFRHRQSFRQHLRVGSGHALHPVVGITASVRAILFQRRFMALYFKAKNLDRHIKTDRILVVSGGAVVAGGWRSRAGLRTRSNGAAIGCPSRQLRAGFAVGCPLCYHCRRLGRSHLGNPG